MIKYIETLIGFSEVPDEISLCINLTNCPIKCSKCHSSYLQQDIGDELTKEKLIELINKNKGITTVCLMGGDNDPDSITVLARVIQQQGLKSAWYSGRDSIGNIKYLDYIKIGPYIEEYGPLNKNTTNQKFYKIINNKLQLITDKFWKGIQ